MWGLSKGTECKEGTGKRPITWLKVTGGFRGWGFSTDAAAAVLLGEVRGYASYFSAEVILHRSQRMVTDRGNVVILCQQ